MLLLFSNDNNFESYVAKRQLVSRLSKSAIWFKHNVGKINLSRDYVTVIVVTDVHHAEDLALSILPTGFEEASCRQGG